MKGHKELKRAKGGNVEDALDRKEEGEGKVDAFDAKGSHIENEAKERKKGGKVARKDGGRTEREVEGKKPRHSMGRPGRKDGGRVGSDKSPLSSAHDVTGAKEHRVDD
jgi:hypothetical protein